MKNFNRSLDDLEEGVKQLLLQDRCSFSDEEKAILNDCLELIRLAKEKEDLSILVRLFDILIRLFVNVDQFKDFF